MGTRATIKVLNENAETLVNIFCMYDGYLSGVGDLIKNTLHGGNCSIINGLSGQSMPAFFNGIDCLAAYLVGQLKTRIGGVYLSPLADGSDADYQYILFLHDGILHIKITSYDDEIYNGPLKAFDSSVSNN